MDWGAVELTRSTWLLHSAAISSYYWATGTQLTGSESLRLCCKVRIDSPEACAFLQQRLRKQTR